MLLLNNVPDPVIKGRWRCKKLRHPWDRREGLGGYLVSWEQTASGCSRSAESLVWCTLGPGERERGQQQLLPTGGIAPKGGQPKAKTFALAISYSYMSMDITCTHIYIQIYSGCVLSHPFSLFHSWFFSLTPLLLAVLWVDVFASHGVLWANGALRSDFLLHLLLGKPGRNAFSQEIWISYGVSGSGKAIPPGHVDLFGLLEAGVAE